MEIVKYVDKGNVRCKCGEFVLFDGYGKYEIPVGVGGAIDGLVVDKVRYTGWVGDCMGCRKRIFAYKSKKIIRKKINL